jgi:hypothetical protein
MEDNYDPSIPKWVDANDLKTSIYNDAHVNVLKEALPFQKDHISKGIERKRWNPKSKNYNYENLTRLVEFFSKICAFYRVRGHVITKCPQIDSKMKEGFIKHAKQQMLNIDFVEQT